MAVDFKPSANFAKHFAAGTFMRWLTVFFSLFLVHGTASALMQSDCKVAEKPAQIEHLLRYVRFPAEHPIKDELWLCTLDEVTPMESHFQNSSIFKLPSH